MLVFRPRVTNTFRSRTHMLSLFFYIRRWKFRGACYQLIFEEVKPFFGQQKIIEMGVGLIIIQNWPGTHG